MIHMATDKKMGLPKGDGECVLVIEDDEDVRDVMLEYLDILGYRAVDGGDGTETLTIAARECPDLALVLADYALARGVNGSELARAIQDAFSGSKVLMLTGYAEERFCAGDGVRAADYPVLNKPFQMEAFARKVHEALRN